MFDVTTYPQVCSLLTKKKKKGSCGFFFYSPNIKRTIYLNNIFLFYYLILDLLEIKLYKFFLINFLCDYSRFITKNASLLEYLFHFFH
jgi:hypothetical protein